MSLLPPSLRIHEKTAVCKPGSGLSLCAGSARTLILHFSTSRTVRHKWMLFRSSGYSSLSRWRHVESPWTKHCGQEQSLPHQLVDWEQGRRWLPRGKSGLCYLVKACWSAKVIDAYYTLYLEPSFCYEQKTQARPVSVILEFLLLWYELRLLS